MSKLVILPVTLNRCLVSIGSKMQTTNKRCNICISRKNSQLNIMAKPNANGVKVKVKV